ncbi:MAG: PEP-CTERM sorting domain-containing protein [Fimbriiglobus sp.]
MPRFPLTAAVVAAAAVMTAAPAARAGLMPVNVTVTPDGGNHRWNYAIVLPTDSQLRPGNFFTIYDFAGYIPGTASAPAGWTLAVANQGQTPNLLAPDDDNGLPNLTWTYNGPAANTNGQIGLGNFWALSMFGAPTEDYFTARTHRTSDGKLDSNLTTTNVPVPTAVPEPGTLILAGLGLPLVGLARWTRRKVSRG